MAFRFFFVPIRDPSLAESELNSLLARSRVVAVDRRWVDDGANSGWALCVDVFDSSVVQSSIGKGRVDFKQLLSPEEFQRFARLRDLRKSIAQEEAVPAYTIFTNDQLAEVVRKRVASLADLERITGIGSARVAKYGPKVLEILRGLETGKDSNGAAIPLS